MLSYRELISDATQTLYDCCDTPRIDAEYLMQHTLKQSMAWLISYGDSRATAEHTKTFNAMIAQRAQGVPVAYLMGYRDFWTLRLEVNNAVLIPRGDTEILVEQAIERLDPTKANAILDMGTGSGAIALSLAKELPLSSVIALDKENKALNVAKRNANTNAINNIEFKISDWFSSVSGEKFDLIVSNPPYIDADDPHLSQGDLRFEPASALIAPDQGLSDLHSIIIDAPKHLKDGGFILLEHGYQQADAVQTMLKQADFERISLYADLNHLPRCTAAQWRAL